MRIHRRDYVHIWLWLLHANNDTCFDIIRYDWLSLVSLRISQGMSMYRRMPAPYPFGLMSRPIHVAVAFEKVRTIKLLLSEGADVMNMAISPSKRAQQSMKLVMLLIYHSLNVSVCITYAIGNRDPRLVSVYLTFGARTYYNGDTFLKDKKTLLIRAMTVSMKRNRCLFNEHSYDFAKGKGVHSNV